MEKNIELGYLLDFYGEFLTEHQARLLSMHVNEDLSLAEIAEKEGISRQGVHDSLKRAEQRLKQLETKMRLLSRTERTLNGLQKVKDHLSGLMADPRYEQQRTLICDELDRLIGIWEDGHGI